MFAPLKKCLIGCFTGVPTDSYQYQEATKRWGAAPNYAQEIWWDCYGGDNGPSALVPDGVNAKLPVDQRPADVFYVHATGYWGATWQMPPSDLRTR